MKTLRRRRGSFACVVCTAGLSLVFACSEDDPLLPSDTPTGSDAGVDGSSPPNDDAGASDASEASADAGGDSGACEDVLPPGSKPTTPALCDPSKWTAVSQVDFPHSNLDVLRAVTPDELTLAWAATYSHFTTLQVGDRASKDAAFGNLQEVVGFGEGSLLGLSPDGLRLCGNGPSGTHFVEATRASRTEAFGEPTEGSFSAIDADAAARGATLQGCVIAPDDRTLYYNLYDPATPELSLHVSKRADASPWPVGTPVASCALRAGNGASFHPTGVSSDQRTIFLQSALVPAARMATRAGADWPFADIVDLNERASVVPNQNCDRIYFNGSKDGVDGIFVASSN